MGLFKKREVKRAEQEGIPELPELPQLPELPSIEELEKTKLPSFPPSKTGRDISHEMIKSSISERPEPFFQKQIAEPIIPIVSTLSAPKLPKTIEIGPETRGPSVMEISDWPKKFAPAQRTREEMPEIQRSRAISEIKTFRAEKPKKTGPVFIRIDKFEEAISSFREIKKKVSEIENLLKTVKEVKAKEESELSEWEFELQKIKSKIEGIDKSLFSELD